MKIKIRNSDGHLLTSCIHNLGDNFINMPFDAATETVLCIDNNPAYLDWFKYKWENNEVRKLSEYSLLISTSAVDSDGDGVLDMPADGTSSITLIIQKKDESGNDVSGNDSVWVSCTSGKLDTIFDRLSNGRLEVELISTKETVLASVKASTKNILIKDATIQIQFRPE